MKKVFSALLAGFFLCLTLTSCALFEKNEEPVTEPHEDTYFMLASLPDIGKYKSTDIKDCYYPSGALDEFKPDDGYGGIVPYCCGIEKYSSADSDEYFIASYGLACTDGRIITHGIYSDVQLLTSSDGKAIYSCTRKSESEESKVFDIITARGSKMFTVETTADAADTFSFYYDFPCECFTVSDINDGVMLFDFNGNMIVNLTEVFGADCYFRVCYCDGEKIIFCASPEAYPYETTADTDFYCVDKKGELLYTLNFGEFAPDSYAGGYLVLRGRDGMRLSDVLGNIITGDKTYENIVYDKLGKSFWCFDKDKSTLEKLDRSGETVLSKKINGIRDVSWQLLSSSVCSTILVRDNSDSSAFILLSVETGEEIEIDTEGLSYIGDISDGKYDYLAAYYDTYADFYDASGTYITTIKDIEDYYSAQSGKIAYRDSENNICIKGLKVSGDFKIKLSEEDTTSVWIADFDNSAITVCRLAPSGSGSIADVYNIGTKQAIIKNLHNYQRFQTEYGAYYTGFLEGEYVLLSAGGEKLISITDNSLV